MARTQRIIPRRSGTPAAVPASGTLYSGEIAINYADNLWWYGDGSGDPVTPPFISTNINSTIETNVVITRSSNHLNPAYASYDTTLVYSGGLDFAATIISWHTIGGWGLEDLDGGASGTIVTGCGRPALEYGAVAFNKTASTTAVITLGTGHGLSPGDKIGIAESSDNTQLPVYTVYILTAATATTVSINTGVSGTVVAGSCSVITNDTYVGLLSTGGYLYIAYDGATLNCNINLPAVNSIFDESGNDRLTAPYIPCAAVNGNTIVQDVLDDHETRIDTVESKTADADRGDITVSSSGTVWTIDNNAVTFAKIQDINTNTLLGRSSGGSGDVQEISCNDVGRSNLAPTVRTITTDAQTISVADGTIIMNPGADVSLNLPAVDSTIIGKTITIKNVSTYTITIDADSTDTIDGSLTYQLVSQYESVTLLAASTNTWYIL